VRRHFFACVACGLVSGVALLALAATPPAEVVRPTDLRCNYLANPLGIDNLHPALSWKLTTTDSSRRGLSQSACQVLVARERSLLDSDRPDLWNSERLQSQQSIHVPYQGKPLEARMQCWWKVRVWDERGRVSAWSEPAFWSMGLPGDRDWQQAKWIGFDPKEDDQAVDIADLNTAKWLWFPEGNAALNAPAESRFFRRAFSLPENRKVRRAVCFFAGDDACQFWVNGAAVGVSHGHPNLVVAEISPQLRPGTNLLAASDTNAPVNLPQNPGGWIGAVRIDFDEGPPLIVQSDRSWKCAKQPGGDWRQTSFDDATWIPAMELGALGIAPWGQPWKAPYRVGDDHRRLAARYLRHEFQIGADKTVRRATAYVCGLGFFDLHVNGQLIGDQLMNPALTGYDRRALYATFDVTPNVRTGANAVGIVLSNGRFFAPRFQIPVPMHTYGYPKLIAQIHVEFADGTDQTVVSDASWKLTAEGPIRASSEFDGEEYDARREMPGWSAAGFDDALWQSVSLVDPPGGQLEAQTIEPIRVTKELKPVQIVEPKPGVWMVDFGQAFYGVVRLRVAGPAGTRVTLRTSFNVLPDGTLNFHNDRSARNTDVYELKGDGVETWHPRFRGNATRWVQIEGFPGTPTPESFTGLVTHTDHQSTGTFECSSELLNRIYQNACWGTRLQNRSVPMEPDRDERMPWSGHPAKTSESEGWVFNVARFYEHFLHNYRAHQAEDGSLQEILPPYWTFNHKDIVWPSVVTIIPDWYYNFYGDDRPLRDNYDMMKRFVLYHERTNLKPDATMDFCTYGDWVDAASIDRAGPESGATSRPLIGTAYFYQNCRIVERAARLLGHAADQQYFAALADRVQAAFNRRFFDAASGTYESKTQCSYVLPLAFHLVRDEHRQAVADHLVSDIMVKHKGHTSVGLIGMQWQMQVLTDIGRPDVGYQIATRTDRPSWGYMVSRGATTSWERWDTDTQDGGMNGESQKILSGNFEAWCYQTLGGINYDPEQPGFKHIVLRPHPVGDLRWVRAAHTSMYGKIESDWETKNDRLHWRIVVPPGTTATVVVPTPQPNSVTESGQPIGRALGVRKIGQSAGTLSCEVGSGEYHFESAK
jgi:alpha-L-rhamnosidase